MGEGTMWLWIAVVRGTCDEYGDAAAGGGSGVLYEAAMLALSPPTEAAPPGDTNCASAVVETEPMAVLSGAPLWLLLLLLLLWL